MTINSGNNIGGIDKTGDTIGQIEYNRGATLGNVERITDLGLNGFKNKYPEIFKNIDVTDRKTHYGLANSLVEKLSLMEIIKIITDKNIDSNIRLEVIISVSRKQIITKDLLENSSNNNLIFTENDDGTVSLYSRVYFQTLMLFPNGKVVKGILESVEEEKDNVFIYAFSGNRIYNSRGEVIKR